jgi:hypothetical protein
MELYENSFTSDVAYCLKYIKEWGIKNKIYGFDGFDNLDVESYGLNASLVKLIQKDFFYHSKIC